jgi:hypothetical protein
MSATSHQEPQAHHLLENVTLRLGWLAVDHPETEDELDSLQSALDGGTTWRPPEQSPIFLHPIFLHPVFYTGPPTQGDKTAGQMSL